MSRRSWRDKMRVTAVTKSMNEVDTPGDYPSYCELVRRLVCG